MFIHRDTLPPALRTGQWQQHLPEFLPVSIVKQIQATPHLPPAWLLWVPIVSITMTVQNFVAVPDFLRGPELPDSQLENATKNAASTAASTLDSQPGAKPHEQMCQMYFIPTALQGRGLEGRLL